jgi:hypothetical protein
MPLQIPPFPFVSDGFEKDDGRPWGLFRAREKFPAVSRRQTAGWQAGRIRFTCAKVHAIERRHPVGSTQNRTALNKVLTESLLLF